MAKNNSSGSSVIGIILLVIILIIIILAIILIFYFYSGSPYRLIQQKGTGFYLYAGTNVGVDASPLFPIQWIIYRMDPDNDVYYLKNASSQLFLSYTAAVDGASVITSTNYTKETSGWIFNGNDVTGYYLSPQADTTLSLLPLQSTASFVKIGSIDDDKNVFFTVPG